MKIQILPSALSDLALGFAFYELQQNGLGRSFINQLSADFETLVPVAGSHRRLVKSFPFAIYYYVENDTALVNAVLDCRRESVWLRARQAERPGLESEPVDEADLAVRA